MLQRADERNSLPDLLEDFLVKNLSLLPDVAECRGQMRATAYLISWRIFLSKICRSCQMTQRADESYSLSDLLKDFLVKNLLLLPDDAEGR